MNVAPTATIRVQHRYGATVERVFDTWLDPAQARQFLFATPSGTMVRADINPRVHGQFVFTDRRDGEDIEHTGRYLVIDRPRLLVFTFAVPKFSAQETTVTVDVHPAEGGSEVTLTHEGVLPDYAERTQQGWGMILQGLERALG